MSNLKFLLHESICLGGCFFGGRYFKVTSSQRATIIYFVNEIKTDAGRLKSALPRQIAIGPKNLACYSAEV